MDQIEAYLVSWNERTFRTNNPDETWGVYTFRKLSDDQEFKVVGVIQNELRRERVRMILEGTWAPDPYSKYERAYQFKLSNHVVMRPSGKEGMIAFLTTAPHIGKIIAEKIWNLWGENSAQQIINNEGILAENKLLTFERNEEARETLQEGIKNATWYMPLVNLFAGIGFPKKLPQQVIAKKWGDPIKRISANPFILLDFYGVGFYKVDDLRRRLQLPDDFPPRLEAATAFSVGQYTSDTWITRNTVIQDLMKFLTLPKARCEEILDAATTDGTQVVAFTDETDQQWIALRSQAQYEANVTRQIISLTTTAPQTPWPEMGDMKLSPHQLEEVTKAFQNGSMAWLLGNAGSGKTYTTAKIMQRCQQAGNRIIACAPTGKAALRLKQALLSTGLTTIQPTTIHRALQATIDSKRGFYFKVDGKTNFVEADLLVIEEMSMLGNELGCRLLKATRPGTKILCVGDPNQLAPVGRGTLLRDWPNWCDLDYETCTYGKLQEIQRHAGQIIRTAAQICKGQFPELEWYERPGFSYDTEHNLHAVSCSDDMQLQERLLRIIEDAQQGNLQLGNGQTAHPIRDLQIVVAVNEDSPASRDEINRILQDRLNPNGGGKHEFYRVGDKVICTKNSMLKSTNREDKKERFVANGSLGYVVESDEKRIIVQMDDYEDHRLVVPTGRSIGDFNLAYAITCHKMQGSQAPIVITLMSGGKAYRVVDRGWFYTAITRATDLSILLSNSRDIQRACNRTNIEERQSFIRTWLRRKFSKQTIPS